MSAARLVTGSWRLRHGEPISDGDAALALAPLDGIDFSHRLVRIERGLLDQAMTGAIPLAILAGADGDGDGDGDGEIAYLLHALDTRSALFVRTGEAARRPAALADRLAAEFADWYLRLNNNECFYCTGGNARSTLSIAATESYWQLGHRIHAALDDGDWAPFVPQFRVPPRHWHCDIHAYDVQAGSVPDRLIVTANGYARKRTSWQQRLVTAELIRIEATGEATVMRSGEIAIGPDGEAKALAAFVRHPVAPLARWRKLAMEIPCESLATGNLFKLTIEALDPLDVGGASHLLASIAYDKTRGPVEPGSDGSDLDLLLTHLEAEIAAIGGASTHFPGLFAALTTQIEAMT